MLLFHGVAFPKHIIRPLHYFGNIASYITAPLSTTKAINSSAKVIR